MLVMLSTRRLKPGAREQFRSTWDPGEALPPGFQRAYHARNIPDEDEVISFGLFEMDEEEYRRWREAADRSRANGSTACRRSSRTTRLRRLRGDRRPGELASHRVACPVAARCVRAHRACERGAFRSSG